MAKRRGSDASSADEFSPEETARRRDEVVRRMANTPPQPRVSPLGRQPKKKGRAASDQAARKKRSDAKEA